MSERPRYAIYFAPEEAHPLWKAGCRWLGRDPSTQGRMAQPRCDIEAPRRYGFHATLKAPMALRQGGAAADFLNDVDRLAAFHDRFEMPRLSVQWLGDFLALRPEVPIAAGDPLQQLADDCVRTLDPWRTAPDPAEPSRRSAGLDHEQCALLTRWGYPHVLQRWLFHMTLSDPIAGGERERRDRIERAATAHFFDSLRAPLHCESLTVFVEPAPGESMHSIHRAALAR